MAIFIANLAYLDPQIVDIAKTAILSASLLAGLSGFFILRAIADRDIDKNEEETENLDGLVSRDTDGNEHMLIAENTPKASQDTSEETKPPNS